MSVKGLLLLSGIASAFVFFATFIVMLIMLPDYSVSGSYISELSAQGSPVQRSANIFGFLVPGVFFFLFGVGTYQVMRESAIGTIGALLLAAGGLLYTLVAIAPCDPGCENVTTLGTWHEFFSDASLYLGSGSIFFIAIALARRARPDISKTLLGLTLLAATAGAVFTYFYLHVNTGVGEFLQKFAVGIPFAIMGILSLYLYREQTNAPYSAYRPLLIARPQQGALPWSIAIVIIIAVALVTWLDATGGIQ